MDNKCGNAFWWAIFIANGTKIGRRKGNRHKGLGTPSWKDPPSNSHSWESENWDGKEVSHTQWRKKPSQSSEIAISVSHRLFREKKCAKLSLKAIPHTGGGISGKKTCLWRAHNLSKKWMTKPGHGSSKASPAHSLKPPTPRDRPGHLPFFARNPDKGFGMGETNMRHEKHGRVGFLARGPRARCACPSVAGGKPLASPASPPLLGNLHGRKGGE